MGPVAVGWALGGYQSPLAMGRPATQAPTDPGTGGGTPGGAPPVAPPGVLPPLPPLPNLPVPEPGTWLLMLGGLAAVVWRARRR